MSNEDTVERRIYEIECKDGHKSELRLKPDGNFPTTIKCPKLLSKGQRCGKVCEITKVKKEVVKKTAPKVEKRSRPEGQDYNFGYFKDKTSDDIAELLETAHDYCVSKGLTATFRKHYVSFAMNKHTICRFGVGKHFMSMPFNSHENIEDDRVKDTSHAIGDNFMYFWTKITPDDIEMVKQRVNEAIVF